MGESRVLGAGGEDIEGANCKKKPEEKLRKNKKKKFDWKWFEKHWELQEIHLKAEKWIGNP